MQKRSVESARVMRTALNREQAAAAAAAMAAAHSPFDVASTGRLSDNVDDTHARELRFLRGLKTRDNVGGRDGFNQFAPVGSSLAVDRIQGFRSAGRGRLRECRRW